MHWVVPFLFSAVVGCVRKRNSVNSLKQLPFKNGFTGSKGCLAADTHSLRKIATCRHENRRHIHSARRSVRPRLNSFEPRGRDTEKNFARVSLQRDCRHARSERPHGQYPPPAHSGETECEQLNRGRKICYRLGTNKIAVSLLYCNFFTDLCVRNNLEKRCKAVAFPAIVFYFCGRHIELRKCNFILVRRT